MDSRLVFLCFIILVHAESSIQKSLDITNSTHNMAANNFTPSTHVFEVKPLEKSLWLHRPEALQLNQSLALEAPRIVVQRQPFFVTKLTRLLGMGVPPYLHKVYFEPFERRKKPVVILALKKHEIAPIKVTLSKSPGAAVLQSPYNEIDDHGLDQSNFIDDAEKTC